MKLKFKITDRKQKREWSVAPMNQWFAKTAQMLCLTLMLSALMPILASAQTSYSGVSFNNGTVKGSVYLDHKNGDETELLLYGPSGQYVGVVKATYANYFDEAKQQYKYDFQTVVDSAYRYVKLHSVVDSVYETVDNAAYNSGNDNDSDNGSTTPGGSTGGSSGNGGGVTTPGDGSTAVNSIKAGADGSLDAQALKDALAKGDTLEIVLNGDMVNIPAWVLKESGDNKQITVRNGSAVYYVPLATINYDSLASSLSVGTSDLYIRVTVKFVSESMRSTMQTEAAAMGGKIIGTPADFNLEAATSAGKTSMINTGNVYVPRSLNFDTVLNQAKTTAFLYNETTKTMTFVPAFYTFSDGKTDVMVKRQGNSIYGVLELNKTFSDIKGHWAESNITMLANKLVVDGVTNTTFQPDRSVTRAEFAAMLVRSLGIQNTGGTSTFKDVASNQWYADVVATAAKLKLVDGYEDGTFRPNNQITREELSAMVVRALSYAGVNTSTEITKGQALLTKFNDSHKIVWAKDEIAAALSLGIIDGMTSTTIEPLQQATRAQSATMLKRFLTAAKFI
ncbi:S-layer homology domain-containing protein [Paenibacillus chitinolyticus]|uniref:S-layer homology domain-containing protein n=1 Tax=Paenibacillus chitinolyticus TaxID=79263 RepID=UPI002DBEAEE5|nr:S-layer homology domain-containing protein [Paenibacillus chitinolyticus]MEC0245082.1 S-layer homology domain-containing protein [Paenibacillus chitinolyticus]